VGYTLGFATHFMFETLIQDDGMFCSCRICTESVSRGPSAIAELLVSGPDLAGGGPGALLTMG